MADALDHEVFVRLARAQRQGVAEQADAKVGVFHLAADVARQRVAGQKLVEQLRRIVGVRVAGIGGVEVARHPWQRGAMRRQIEQGDLPVATGGDLHGGGQELRHGVVQRDLALADHVGQQEVGETLRDRADLEDRLPVDRLAALRSSRAVADRAARLPVDQSDGDPDAAFFHVDALAQEFVDLLICG